MALTFYGYKKCSTSRKAEKFLSARNIDYKFVDITEKPPSKAVLSRVLKTMGVEPKKLFNTSGVLYRERDLKNKAAKMSKDEILVLLSREGKLIKRPLVTDGKKATVGFREDLFNELWV